MRCEGGAVVCRQAQQAKGYGNNRGVEEAVEFPKRPYHYFNLEENRMYLNRLPQMRNGWLLAGISVGLLAAWGCGTGTAPTDDNHEEDDLSARIVTSPDELRTLDEISFQVYIEDGTGGHMMDMEDVRLEYRQPGGEWREIDLMTMEDHYMGTRIFASSGDYELRVMGMAHEGYGMDQMHSMSIHVERSHVEVGEYHVEYESDPGHIHEGETAMLTFWVQLEDGGDAATGLVAQITVEESDGHVTTLNAVEVKPGVYQAEVEFADGGETNVTLVIGGPDGDPVEADFHFRVAEGH